MRVLQSVDSQKYCAENDDSYFFSRALEFLRWGDSKWAGNFQGIMKDDIKSLFYSGFS